MTSGKTANRTRHTAPIQAKKRGKVMVFIVLLLMTCSVWMMYSHGLQHFWDTDESDAAAADAAPVKARPLVPSEYSSYATNPPGTVAVRPSEANEPAPTKEAEGAPPDSGLEKRVEPIEALARRGDPGAVPAMVEALHDDDWRVRSRVMDAAVNAYIPIPEGVLIEHAQSDPSADVRFLALAGIVSRIDPAIPQVPAIDPTTARAIARQALSDASEQVRWQAQQVLDALDTDKTGANDPPQAEGI